MGVRTGARQGNPTGKSCLPGHFGVWWPKNSYKVFLDALASLGSMLESESVINVFEILSNLGHIFRLSSGYAQGRFRVCSEYVQSMFIVCSEYVQSMFRV